MAVLAPILEIKRTLRGVEKRFESGQLLASRTGYAVVLWVAPQPMHVHGVDLPAGTVSFGHFWEDRGYNVYHWLDGAGRTVGYYFNIADETRISPNVNSWRDLVLDVLATPDGRCQVLDEHELPARCQSRPPLAESRRGCGRSSTTRRVSSPKSKRRRVPSPPWCSRASRESRRAARPLGTRGDCG